MHVDVQVEAVRQVRTDDVRSTGRKEDCRGRSLPPGRGAGGAFLITVSAIGNSPWPTVIPPESVPALLYTRLLATCRLCAQPWTKTPPPPWELSRMVRPSIEDGLHS